MHYILYLEMDLSKVGIFYIFAPNIEMPHRNSPTKYKESMFLSQNERNNLYPCKPDFSFYKVVFPKMFTTQTSQPDDWL